MPPPPPPKRRPTVLVTDSRDPGARGPQRRSSAATSIPSMARFISVDSVLQNSSEIPSGQSRNPLANLQRSRGPISPSTPRPTDPRRFLGQNLPIRSSKLSEKLVLLPETEEEGDRWDYAEDDNDDTPIKDDEEEWRNRLAEDESSEQRPRKSYAERLPKSRRAEKLSRVTAYCTADSNRLKATSNFLREKHSARTKLYDECLYCAYHLPLMPGSDGYRVRSSPVLKSPGGKAVLDVQIERSEQRDYREGYFENAYSRTRRPSGDGMDGEEEGEHGQSKSPENTHNFLDHRDSRDEETYRPESPRESQMEMKSFAEMFVFSYGVVVFWNLTERQEKDILADLTFAGNDLGTPLIMGPMKEEDFETEEFHFQYSSRTRSPRIYNDMITLRSGDIMIKLAISHAIAQSTKLCRFEERMNSTMLGVQHIPKKLALTGNLGMKREEVVKMSGRLFKLRVDVNLSSNVLDVPEFFWDSEPTLHPLYAAVREYLEIKQRILVLNERCRVFLDLADILSDSIADSNMSRITWIIIILIVLSIFVTVAEVAIRFGILKKKGTTGAGTAEL